MNSTNCTSGDSGEGGSANFKLRTAGCCFLCLNTVRKPLEEGVEVDSSVSLAVLVRFLGINVMDAFSSAFAKFPTVLESCNAWRKSDINVELCEACRKMCETASELVQMREHLRMELDHCIRSMHKEMLDANRSSTRQNEYSRRIESDLYAVAFRKDTEMLREEFLNKCSTRILLAVPKVKIRRLSDSDSKSDNTRILETNTLDFGNDTCKIMPDENIYKESNYCSIFNLSEAEKIDCYIDESEEVPMETEDSVTTDLNTMGLLASSEEYQYSNECIDVSETNQKVALNSILVTENNDLVVIPDENERLYVQETLPNLSAQHLKNRHKCNYCLCTFPTYPQLKTHEDAVHLGVTIRCTYPECPQTFKWKIQLDRHIIKVHLNTKCEHCCRNVPKDTYDTHIAICSAKAWVKCHHCEKKFPSAGALYSHRSQKHKKNEFTCTKCGKAFSQKSYLTSHYNKVHLKIKYACAYPGCGKKFPRSEMLSIHLDMFHPNPIKAEK